MKFTVVWAEEALAKLAELWLDADGKAAVERDSNEIDRQLESDPLHCGESRSAELRIVCQETLIAVFRVFPDDCRVIVQDVRLNRR